MERVKAECTLIIRCFAEPLVDLLRQLWNQHLEVLQKLPLKVYRHLFTNVGFSLSLSNMA